MRRHAILICVSVLLPIPRLAQSATSTTNKDDATPLTIGAAVSTREPLTAWESARTAASSRGPKPVRPLRFTFAGSNALLRQLRADGDIAVLVTADAQTMRDAIAAGLVDARDTRIVARNEVWLATAVKPGANPAPRDLAELRTPPDGKVAIPQDGVPLSRYALSYLEAHGLLAAWRPALVRVENAEASATWLKRGLVTHAFVYGSDAARPDAGMRAVATLPRRGNWLATYHAAPTKRCPDRAACAALVQSLRDEREPWRAHGFLDPLPTIAAKR